MKFNNSKKEFFLILIFISFKITNEIQIPIKLVKSNFGKRTNKKLNSIDKSNISQDIKNLNNYLFAIDIKFGSNGQSFTMLIDTGSEIAWVPGIISENNNKYYNPGSSTTSRRTSDSLSYRYASGSVSGQYYTDQINFMIRNNFYFTFGVVTTMNLERSGFDGILGLGRKYATIWKKYSILETIKTNGGVSSTIFSFKYDNNSKNLTFCLGEKHEDFKNSNVASCPLIQSEIYDNRLWLCELYSFGIKKGNEIIKSISIDYEGLFDTGTNNMMFPLELLDELQSTFISFNCYIYDESDSSLGRAKAIYCRDGNNLPKITFGVKSYIFTLGSEKFYNKIFVNNEYIYRLRLLFSKDEICIIGQSFFYEFHTLFDDNNGELKFYGGNEGDIKPHEEKTRIRLWVLLSIIFGGVIVLASAIFILVYCLCCRKKEYSLLNKELLEMSSIQRIEDTVEETADTTFNQIMNITSTRNSRFNKSLRRNQNNKN